MPNLFIVLPVPAADGPGTAVDVSALSSERTISVDGGAFSGQLVIEGSNNGGLNFHGLPDAPVFSGPSQTPAEITNTVQFMRVRRRGSSGGNPGTPNVTLGGELAAANVFGVPAMPPGDGVGAPLDLSAGGAINTFILTGVFSGFVTVELSNDGVNFSGGLRFTTAGVQTFVGTLNAVRVRRSGVTDASAPILAVGSGGSVGASGFPGFGPAPPAVSPVASSAGAAAFASRNDHTHLAGPAARAGANLGNADTTVQPFTDGASLYTLPAATLTVGTHVVNLGVAGPPPGNMTVQIIRRDLTANVYTVRNFDATVLFVFPGGGAAPSGVTCYFDGVNWNFLSFYFVGTGP